MTPRGARLLLIDLQPRLMAAIDGGPAVIANAVRLARGHRLDDADALHRGRIRAASARPSPISRPARARARQDGVRRLGRSGDRGPARRALSRTLILAGCEAHVCVLQTALALLARGHPVAMVADAVGSRTSANHRAGLDRAARHGAEIVTTEMVLFEWLGTAAHPAFAT